MIVTKPQGDCAFREKELYDFFLHCSQLNISSSFLPVLCICLSPETTALFLGQKQKQSPLLVFKCISFKYLHT